MSHPEFEAVIGLEVHCQLATDTKIFCGCPTRQADGRSVADAAVNGAVCPVCAGHPGSLPVLNKKVVEYAVRAGLATHCTINPRSVFSRKNYFYPDLPKGYQISQYDLPICEHGGLEIPLKNGETKRVSITRIHMEEDAGKNIHMEGMSLVNLNRACVPLIEIVSGPDMKSSDEAGAYLRALHAIVTHLGICDGNMQEGNFRCDANVSVMPKGSTQLGTRAEVKNVNSFRYVEKAIDHEIQRQIEVIRGGGKIVQETRLYDADKDATFSMRSKEEAHDYRYFPEPDLIPLVIEKAWIEQIRGTLPELPEQKRARLVGELGLSSYDAGVLTSTISMSNFFDQALKLADKSLAKPLANLLTGEVARLINEETKEIGDSKLRPEHLAEAVKFVAAGTISSTGAKTLITAAWKTGDAASTIVDREGLKQVSDTGALETIIDQVIAKNPGQAADFKAGKEKLLGFFVGQVMKESGGKANPTMLQDLIRKKLSSI